MLKPKRLNKKIVGFSLLVLLVMVTPAMVFHEAGHALVCWADGNKYDMSVTAFGAYTVCYGDVGEDMLYRAFGGLFASIMMMAPVASKQIRTVPWRFIPLVSLAIGHFINAMVETFLYESYINQSDMWVPIFGLVSYIIFIGLLMKYGRTDAPRIKDFRKK
jgi:hypothetical protein